MEWMYLCAILAIVSGALAVLSLAVLHVTSPEFHPGWRMISEYALGKHKWLLTLMFLSWGTCSLLTAMLIWQSVTSVAASISALCVAVSGIGAIMGGLFDVKHKLHGLSFALGVPTLPAGALLASYHLSALPEWNVYRTEIRGVAHLTWVCVLLMAVSMGLLFSGFKKAGLPLGKDVEPPKTLPSGVIGINGYFNRLLVVCFIGWTVLIAIMYLKTSV